jgi:hypothetical protein
VSDDWLTDEEKRVLKALASSLVRSLGRGGSEGAGSSRPVADDAELDSRFGDPSIRKDPKRWAGASYVGCRYSQCPTDYLLCLAESNEFFADKDKAKPDPPKHQNGKPWWEYNLKDAARARGWAVRNRGKAMPPPGGEPSAPNGDPNDFDQRANGGDEWVP